MRIAIRVYLEGILESEERLEVTNAMLGGVTHSLAVKHARMLATKAGHIEIEFLDELNPRQRFFRIGTDPSYMVWPIRVDLK